MGFVGAIAHFELDWRERARRPIVAISLETSRTLPNALIGQGPVVRLGDRRTVFDPGYLHILRSRRTGVARATPAACHGRRHL